MSKQAKTKNEKTAVSAKRAQETEPLSKADLTKLFFSDETETFRSPAEPDPGEAVTLRLRAERNVAIAPFLLVETHSQPIVMEKAREEGPFDWYEATIACADEPLSYRFVIKYGKHQVVYRKNGASLLDANSPLATPGALADEDPSFDFRIVPGFHTPAWAQGALQYQIFPDRFANGNPDNDVRDAEYAYDDAPVRHIANWNETPLQDNYRHFYGGDLQGVMAKLDYLQSLGVEAIYLNPIFVSPSAHRYDTQDYNHVDPHLAVIVDDIDHPLPEGDVCNAHALQYIRRTTSPKNLAASDEFFAGFCEEIHRRGMRIILDGVFNHCGSFSPWMDREGIYHASEHKPAGAFRSKKSPFRSFFNFNGESHHSYEAWWGHMTLPKLNYEQSPELCDEIIRIAKHWANPPYSIDGWRLDVAADLGHNEQFNHEFWRRFRAELKKENPDLLIVAEHYGDPSSWLQGDQWDTVMNYDAFMEPLTYFLTGLEKHSNHRWEDLYQNGEAFFASMEKSMARFGWPSLACAMNELSNHDHSRFLTRTNGRPGHLHDAGWYAAGEYVDKRVFREGVVVQMTWPGAPTIYYGDEAGQVGWTDPDCRRTYPWGSEDWGLIELHRVLAGLRNCHPALRSGSFAPLGAGWGLIAYGRFLGDDRVAVVCNNADHDQTISLRLRTLGAEDACDVFQILRTTNCGFVQDVLKLGSVESGQFAATVPARSALVLSV